MTRAAKLPDHRLFEIVSRSRPDGPPSPSPRAPGGGPSAGGEGEEASRLRSLVDSVQAGVLIEDPSCRIILANQAFCDLLEIREDPAALVGWEARMVFDAIRERFSEPDEVLDRTEALIHARRTSLSEEVRLANGRTLERDFLPIVLDGEYGGHFWIFRDISVHRAAQESQRRSSARLEALSEITSELGEGRDEDLVRALGRVARLLGLRAGLILRSEGTDYVVEHAFPGDGGVALGTRGPVEDLVARALFGDGVPAIARRPQQDPSELSEKSSGAALDPSFDGTGPWAAILPACFSTGEVRHGLVVLTDPTPREEPWSDGERDVARLFALWVGKTLERRRAEESLRKSEERYRDFVENTPGLVCIHDLEGTILEVNRAVVTSLGLAGKDEIVGRNLGDLVEPRHREALAEYLEEIARTGQVSGTMTVVGAEGRRRVLSFDNSLRRDGVEEPVVRGLGQDITERSEAEAALRRRIEVEKLLVAISTCFINVPSAATESAVERALHDLGRFADADACLVYLFDEQRRSLARRYGWIRAERSDAEIPELLPVTDLPTLVQLVGRLQPFQVGRIEDLPESAVTEREHFERYGLRSLLAVPIASRGEVLGLVGLASLTRPIEWREEMVSTFRVVGDILGGALERKASADALEEANRGLQVSNEELAWTNSRMALLNEMGDLLQSSSDLGEAHAVIRDLVPRVCPGQAGAVYLFGEDRHLLEPLISWGPEPVEDAPEPALVANDCWALRRARPYRIGPDSPGPACRHASGCPGGDAYCLPLLAQGEALGILTVRGLEARAPGGHPEGSEQLALSVAEHLALGLANLRLRESLRDQALRDPLTGLYNRRYLEDQFQRELARAKRRGTPLAVLMVDLDHFKRINDVHGHEGGDRTLIEVGELLASRVRHEDLVARYGGEEFTLLLGDTDLAEALQVAEGLRSAIHGLEVGSRGARIQGLSASIGVAAYPECGRSRAELLRLADDALYRAKGTGRDRVVPACRVKPADAAGE